MSILVTSTHILSVFGLPKQFPICVFPLEKDATFYLLQVKDNPPLYAFELVGHPTWFLKHAKRKPYKVLLEKVDENTKNVMDSTFFLSRIPCPENQIGKIKL